MTAYIKGYQAGWTSYLEACEGIDDSLRKLIVEERSLAEQAGQGLTPKQQSDYWLGYFHGRAAAKTRITKQPREPQARHQGRGVL